jgi:hypothetical protein
MRSPDAADLALGDKWHHPCPVRTARAVVTLQAHQGPVAVVPLLMPLPDFPLPCLDHTARAQVQASDVQIRHALLPTPRPAASSLVERADGVATERNRVRPGVDEESEEAAEKKLELAARLPGLCAARRALKLCG